ncbi:hypothetical protein [Enterococcus faecalis]|uniref:hypothetical protein n=1 Tax=Enterococcus faecalis TaxID=1351 RepID=UPI0003541A2A|nr:hypothetical protein [Enterococcus faecalis]EPI31385.1 hypothetical protein D349_01241 [Enterococcus faecalis UP2S-6]
MIFYQVDSPFWALLIVEKKEDCLPLYEEWIGEVEDRNEFFNELIPLNRNEAIKVMAKTISEETMQPIGMEEAMRSITNAIKQKKAKVLGIDQALCL